MQLVESLEPRCVLGRSDAESRRTQALTPDMSQPAFIASLSGRVRASDDVLEQSRVVHVASLRCSADDCDERLDESEARGAGWSFCDIDCDSRGSHSGGSLQTQHMRHNMRLLTFALRVSSCDSSLQSAVCVCVYLAS